MTREEHMQWCKQRAKEEIEYTKNPTQGLISMASDLRKHPETNSEAMINLCMGWLLVNPHLTKAEAIKFIDGFN